MNSGTDAGAGTADNARDAVASDDDVDEGQLWRVLIAASIAQMAVVIDFFALNLALPDMSRDFGVSPTELQWVISGYMISVAACFIAAGRVGDIVGRRRTLVVGAAIFGATSVVGALAPNETVLIVFRILQGVGAAIMWPVGVAVVANAFPPSRLQRALGVLYGFGGIGTALGPLVGGMLSEFVSWRLVLAINAPIAIAVIILVLTSVEESRDETAPRKIDYLGLVLITGGLIVATYAIDEANNWGWLSAKTLGVLSAGILAMVAFVFVENRVKYPLVDLSLFRNRPFVVITAAGAVANIVYVTAIFLSTLFLQDIRGLSPAEASIVFLALSVGAAVSGLISGRLERFLPHWIMTFALAVGGIATILLSASDNWIIYTASFVFVGLGLGLGWAYASVGTQAVVRPERAGEASGVTLTILVSLGGVAIAFASSILAGQSAGSAAEGDTINSLLRAFGGFAVVGAALIPIVGRVERSDMVGVQFEPER